MSIITDSNYKSLEIIQKNLFELNLIDIYDCWLCEEIGFDNENIRKLNLQQPLPSDISSLNIAVLTKIKKNYSKIIFLFSGLVTIFLRLLMIDQIY